MNKREFILFLLIIVLIIIPINSSMGWALKYQMNKGTDIPFEISESTDDYLGSDTVIADMASVDYILRNTPLVSFPELDLDNYFYIVLSISYRDGDTAKILSLEYDDDFGYRVHICETQWNHERPYYESYNYDHILLKISRSLYEGYSYVGKVNYYSEYGTVFLNYALLDLLVISRIIYLKSKKRAILGSFLESKYISLDRLTKDTLKDLERREELRNAMDPED